MGMAAGGGQLRTRQRIRAQTSPLDPLLLDLSKRYVDEADLDRILKHLFTAAPPRCRPPSPRPRQHSRDGACPHNGAAACAPGGALSDPTPCCAGPAGPRGGCVCSAIRSADACP